MGPRTHGSAAGPAGCVSATPTGPGSLAAWRQGVTALARILLLGVAMDVIHQCQVFGGFRDPIETLVIAAVLAAPLNLLLRGPFTRLPRRRATHH